MLTILHTESSMGWGGQEIRILEESLGMIRRGHRVIIAAPEKSNISKRGKERGIEVFPAGFKKNPFSLLRIISLIDRGKIEIVNTHSSSDSWVATVAARLSRAKPKIIRTRHLSTPISRSYLSRLLYDVLPDAIITTGEEIKRRMVSDNRFDASRIFSIPTGVDLDRFNPAKVKPAQLKNPPVPPFTKGGQGGLRGGFSIGMIGVLRSWKGHKFFIEAVPEILSQIPYAVFYIVGDGPQYENIKNLIQELSLQNRVFMLGHREDIPEILASLDVVVHPSYANEGVPQSILQALAMKKPVVASDAGSIREVIMNGQTGFLIPTKNPYKIASKLIDLYKNPELCARFGEEGRKLIEKHYSIDQMLDKIERLYKTYHRQIE
ncbi:MAG: glycosyltransferase family 4 protein [Thermodesulfovibrionales bacterium]|nr:glycosyltransferase family 4 protein [Thermodesulfovibrionales bacterium]